MVIGTAGAMFTKNAFEPPPEWNEMYFYEYGYARVVAVDSGRLEWYWVSSETNEIMDRMVIEKSDSPSGLSAGEIAAIVVCVTVGVLGGLVLEE